MGLYSRLYEVTTQDRNCNDKKTDFSKNVLRGPIGSNEMLYNDDDDDD